MTDEKTASTEHLDPIEALKDLPHEEIVKHLAQLSPLTRDEYSKKICRARDWRVKTLRAAIAKAIAEEGAPDSDTFIEELTPAETPVAGTELASTISDIFQAHVKAGEHDYTIATLWTLLTYCYDEFDILSKLLINSPQKRCGKSTLLELLEAVVYKGILASGISAASIYRAVALHKPCLLLDEAETYMKQDENIRGIVNAGHKKRLANIYRCDGDDSEPKKFSLWSPMAIAGIGKQAATIMDRSIVINMRRKLPGESVRKMPKRFYEKHRILRMQLLRWAEDHHEAIQGANPVLPPSNNDRMTNNWEPLFSIAEVIGDEWPDKVTEAFKAASAQDVDEDVAIMMLADLREILNESDTGRMHSTDIVTELIKKEGRPWPEWKNGFSITPTALSYLLKPFDVRPRQLKIQGEI